MTHLHSSPSPPHPKARDRAQYQAREDRGSRPSLSVPDLARTHIPSAWYSKGAADVESDDGFDSDATIDLEKGLSSPVLEGAPPLQRMSTDYERVILRSLRRGKATAYACACSLGGRKIRRSSWQHTNWDAESSSSDSDSSYESSSDGEAEDLRLAKEHSSLSICDETSEELLSKKPESAAEANTHNEHRDMFHSRDKVDAV
ncbi:hypothetical protein ACEPAI_9234 [Sanghuangporus weigelae]